MRIGLLGGTFNPIHCGHLHIAEEVLSRLHLDRILFIPSGNPPHKTEEKLPSAADRLEMTRLALLGHPEFEVCDVEVRRPGKSYSVDTLSELKRRFPNDRLFFIIGTDAFYDLPTWREPERLLSLCDFIVISRPDSPFARLPQIGPLKTIDRTALADLDRRAAGMVLSPLPAGNAVYFLAVPPRPISASEIRRKIASGEETKKVLPDPVASYIIKNKLYDLS